MDSPLQRQALKTFHGLKKVFISIPWFSPAYRAGGPVQSVANLVNRPETGFQFYIFTGNADLNGEELRLDAVDEWINFNGCTKVFYSTRQNSASKLKQELKRIQPDKVWVIGLYAWPFCIVPLIMPGLRNVIVSARGMLHPGALSQKPLRKRIFISAYKLLGIHRRFPFHATDQQEAQFIRSVMGEKTSVFVAGNYPRLFRPAKRQIKTSGRLRLACLALISPMKNHLMVLEALAGCDEQIEFNIAGAVKDASYWRLCIDQITRLPANITVNMHGEVPPDKVEEWLSSNGEAFVMPSNSENFGHSLLEALSSGMPVITSSFTPWNGLFEAKAGINTELSVMDIRKSIRYFVAMDEQEFDLFRMGAERYARQAVDMNELDASYRRMFG